MKKICLFIALLSSTAALSQQDKPSPEDQPCTQRGLIVCHWSSYDQQDYFEGAHLSVETACDGLGNKVAWNSYHAYGDVNPHTIYDQDVTDRATSIEVKNQKIVVHAPKLGFTVEQDATRKWTASYGYHKPLSCSVSEELLKN